MCAKMLLPTRSFLHHFLWSDSPALYKRMLPMQVKDEIWEQEHSGLPTTSLPASEPQCESLCEPGEGPSAAFFLLFTKCSEFCSLGDHF